MSFPTFVYVLCFVTSTLCAVLLVRAYRRTRTRLLLWSALSFVLLAVNNFFVAADMLILPDVDLLALRYAGALGAVAVLIYGFIWEVDDVG
jgi:hypothetical protein